MPNILDQNVRLKIIQEIESEENKLRKEVEIKKSDIWNNNQSDYILDALKKEFSDTTVRNMRTLTSVNLTRKFIDELASVYKNEPSRVFVNASEQEVEHLEHLYKEIKANLKLKMSNKKYKVHDQIALYLIPFKGTLNLMILDPSQYDVIPDEMNPEMAYGYVISAADRFNIDVQLDSAKDIQNKSVVGNRTKFQNFTNETIADKDDYKIKKKYYWWTDEYHFSTDNKGRYLNPETQMPADSLDSQFILNPIGKMPFIDVSTLKQFEFWVRSSSNLTQFAIDLGVILSDTCNINRLQGYAQSVMTAVKKPEVLDGGPNITLFLELDPNKPEIRPSFEFVAPSPNLDASLNLVDMILNLFASSVNINPKSLSAKTGGQTATSGIEKFLSMVEKFEASTDDMDLFKDVEVQLFELIKRWNNLLFNVPQDKGGLNPKISGQQINESVELEVEFARPELARTSKDFEDSVMAKLGAGTLSKKKAIMMLENVNEEQAEALLKEIDEEKKINVPFTMVGNDNGDSES